MPVISERLGVALSVVAMVTLGGFLLAVIVPSLVLGRSVVPTEAVTYVRVVLFFAGFASVFVAGPIILYQFRRNRRLQSAINHYVKNKMQEIILSVEVVESNLIKADTEQLTYKQKIEMLDQVKAICLDVSGNLAQKILTQAPQFNRNIAPKDEGAVERSNWKPKPPPSSVTS